eukprot:CAMPEP_0170646774 /NCGR_PEP_ID=MMETSP0224-20130122/43821_1 /TAXON_ID=285029 /ORGANISM="Togula jolla, Strain CCCM 725" /LENGTH=56 /DNA_ID=CAMNT_0010978137 /DNA_START=103 /DNA_END=270 /DNA_ORIENTATION=-
MASYSDALPPSLLQGPSLVEVGTAEPKFSSEYLARMSLRTACASSCSLESCIGRRG